MHTSFVVWKATNTKLFLLSSVCKNFQPVRWARRRAAPRLRHGSSRRARPSTRATSTRSSPSFAAPRRTPSHTGSRARRVPRIPKTQPRTFSSRSDVSDGTNTTRARERRRARRSERRLPSTRCSIDSHRASSPATRRRAGHREPLRGCARRVMQKKTNPKPTALCARRWFRARRAAAPPPATETPSRVSETPCFRNAETSDMTFKPRWN